MARKSLTEKVSRDISIEWGMVHAIMWGKSQTEQTTNGKVSGVSSAIAFRE